MLGDIRDGFLSKQTQAAAAYPNVTSAAGKGQPDSPLPEKEPIKEPERGKLPAPAEKLFSESNPPVADLNLPQDDKSGVTETTKIDEKASPEKPQENESKAEATIGSNQAVPTIFEEPKPASKDLDMDKV